MVFSRSFLLLALVVCAAPAAGQAQVPPADRWAIAAYIRALQLSQRATEADVPADRRQELEQSVEPPAPGQAGEPQPETPQEAR